MKLLSVQLGMPRDVSFQGKSIRTGIFKSPVETSVRVLQIHLEGDGQADLQVHGGEFKAIYAYAAEHYDYWRRQRPENDFVFGAFGENLTIEGLPEEHIQLGDTFEIGTALLQAVQPRMPCFKLGVRFNDPGIIEEFLESKRLGVYFRVLRTGVLQSGDAVKPVSQGKSGVALAQLYDLKRDPHADPKIVQKALDTDCLPDGFRRAFNKKLELASS